MIEVNNTTSWHDQARCKNHPDPDLWFYNNSRFVDEQMLASLRIVEAMQLCGECPVQKLCLKQGMEKDNIEAGSIGGSVWGGLMTSERLLLARKATPMSRYVRLEERARRQVRSLLSRIA